MNRAWTILLLAALAWIPVLGAAYGVVTVRQMLNDDRYWPPACHASPCVLTGLGGLVNVWRDHVDHHLALGRRFVVKGVCASACEIAARRSHATLLPGARLIPHKIEPTVWG